MTSMPPMPRVEPLAEDAVLLRFGDHIDAALNDQVHAAAAVVKHHLVGVEVVPAYASLLLRLDLAMWPGTHEARPWQRAAEAALTALRATTQRQTVAREVELPVLYGGEAGPDLGHVAAHAGLDEAEVIALHSQACYRVAMLGFAPGFPYLLGLPSGLAMPRRADPRLSVPAGSVAIGGQQTGVYPQALPGGWHLIGRTPLTLFDVHAQEPSLLRAGDRVRFRPIDAETFARLAASRGARP